MNLDMELMQQDRLEVITANWDFKYKTDTFIKHPDGRLNPFYNSLHEIPMLPNGTEVDLARVAMPVGTDIRGAGAINNVEYQQYTAAGLPIPVVIGYIVLAVIMLAIVIVFYYLIHPPQEVPPCGTVERIIEISDCTKLITMPNCDTRSFNSCTDEWIDEEWDQHPWQPPKNWMDYIIFGIVGVGAIIIVPKVLEFAKKRRK